jgi:hypothetical protein
MSLGDLADATSSKQTLNLKPQTSNLKPPLAYLERLDKWYERTAVHRFLGYFWN